ncbi:MAG: hypothetical protein K2M47_06690 [Clostridiales bacterium]|nr:hypothetical protein [Clostridiales bacterium]
MAKHVTTKSGKKITLLNPAEKGRKFAAELKRNVHATNDHKIKRDDNGKEIPLTDTQKAWRSGYLAARKDNANCHKAKQRSSKK